jgi:hypothetical protein
LLKGRDAGPAIAAQKLVDLRWARPTTYFMASAPDGTDGHPSPVEPRAL